MDYVKFLNGMGLGMLFFVLLLVVGVYLLSAYAEFQLLKAFNYKYPWMAWVPLAQNYAYGDLCTQTTGSYMSIVNVAFPNILLQFGWVLSVILPYVPVVGSLLNIAWSVVYFGTICDFIYKRVEGQDNKILAGISGWFSIVLVIKIYTWGIVKNNYRLNFRSANTDVYPSRQPVNNTMNQSWGGQPTGGQWNPSNPNQPTNNQWGGQNAGNHGNIVTPQQWGGNPNNQQSGSQYNNQSGGQWNQNNQQSGGQWNNAPSGNQWGSGNQPSSNQWNSGQGSGQSQVNFGNQNNK